jgi:hypothetical protein
MQDGVVHIYIVADLVTRTAPSVFQVKCSIIWDNTGLLTKQRVFSKLTWHLAQYLKTGINRFCAMLSLGINVSL